jgi:hypothetical protein
LQGDECHVFFLPFGCSIPVVHPKATVRNHGNMSLTRPLRESQTMIVAGPG